MSHRHVTADLVIAGLPVLSAGAMILHHAIPALGTYWGHQTGGRVPKAPHTWQPGQ